MHSVVHRTRNTILCALPPDEWRALREEGELVSLPAGHVIYHTGDPITSAYFPSTGLTAAFAVLPSGDQVAVVTIGAEGVIGTPAILGIDTSPHQIRVQVASTGHQMRTTESAPSCAESQSVANEPISSFHRWRTLHQNAAN